jgi:hypothetical protein
MRREEAQLPPPLELNVSVIPEEKGVESLARQIRLTGRAYPLFDIAHLVLKKNDRYNIRISIIKNPDGQPAQPMFLCELDETVWLSENEAVQWVLEKHFATFYQSEQIPTDPPKGTYTFVAQCGISGAILGPPNYHDYQNKLRRIHSERFGNMPLEAYKARVRIVRDEAVVKKWLEDQSFRTEYVCLNVPETIRLGSREEVERHFRETHFATIVKPIDSHVIQGSAVAAQPCRPLQNFARRAVEDQIRFPLKVVNVLSQQFAGHGLQFFKVNKNVTHVAVARPRFLDLQSTDVSDRVRRIVEFIEATPKCTRRKIMEALVPSTAPAAPAPETPAAPAEGSPAPEAAQAPENPEGAAVTGDLHWLIHQGHVIEFANGLIELAKKPAPRPPRPEPAPKPAKEAAPAVTQPVSEAQTAEASGSEAAPEVAATPETAAVVEHEEATEAATDPGAGSEANISAAPEAEAQPGEAPKEQTS